jgi:hypothetical protein
VGSFTLPDDCECLEKEDEEGHASDNVGDQHKTKQNKLKYFYGYHCTVLELPK